MPTVDGAELDLFPDFEVLETIAFVDRRYLGVVATRPGSALYYASLMIRSATDPMPEFDWPAWPIWEPHKLHNAMTDTVSHAREIILSAYNMLSDRTGAG